MTNVPMYTDTPRPEVPVSEYDQLRRKKLAQILSKKRGGARPTNVAGGVLNAIGDGLEGFAEGRAARADIDAAEAERNSLLDLATDIVDGGGGSAAESDASFVPDSDNAQAQNSLVQPSGSRVTRTASTTLSPQQSALLDTIAGTESPGYNVMYGGARFDDLSDHPRQFIPITSGPNKGKKSSAAGRYQFLGWTWDQYAQKLGLQDFSPESQDQAAWALASDVYSRQTGRDIMADLSSGDPNVIAGVGKTLAGTWTSLPGGIEAATGSNRFVQAFNRNLGQYPQAQNFGSGQPGTVQPGNPDKVLASRFPHMPGEPDEVIASRYPQAQNFGVNVGPQIQQPNMTPEGIGRVVDAIDAGRDEAEYFDPIYSGEPEPQAGVAPDQVPAYAAPAQTASPPQVLPNQAGAQQRVSHAPLSVTAPEERGTALAANLLPTSAQPGYGRQRVARALINQGQQQSPVPASVKRVAQGEIKRLQRQGGRGGSVTRARLAQLPNSALTGIIKTQVNRMLDPMAPLERRQAELDIRKTERDLQPKVWRDMSPEEVAKDPRLDPNKAYQRDPNGRIVEVGKSPLVQNNVGTGGLRKKMTEEIGKTWGKYPGQAVLAAQNLADFRALEELITVAPQGPLTGRLAEWFPGFDSAGAAFNAVIKRMAPTFRVEGSGHTSDIEYQGMLDSLPALRNKPEANMMILEMMKAKAAIDIERGQIVNDVMTGEIDEEEAVNRMTELSQRSIVTPEFRAILDSLGPGFTADDEAEVDDAEINDLIKQYGDQ